MDNNHPGLRFFIGGLLIGNRLDFVTIIFCTLVILTLYNKFEIGQIKTSAIDVINNLVGHVKNSTEIGVKK